MRFFQRRVEVISKLEANDLSWKDFRARIELNKFNLTLSVVQNVREHVVYEIELGLIEPERYGESQFFGRTG